MQIKLTFLKLCFTKANQNIMEFRSEQLLFLIDVYVYKIAQFNIHCASFFFIEVQSQSDVSKTPVKTNGTTVV